MGVERAVVLVVPTSISSPMPGYPVGKPAGEPCKHLDSQYRCIYEDRPQVCRDFNRAPVLRDVAARGSAHFLIA